MLTLVIKDSGKEVNIGDEVITFRGELAVVDDICPDYNRVYLKLEGVTTPQGYYPQVINADWVFHESRVEPHITG